MIPCLLPVTLAALAWMEPPPSPRPLDIVAAVESVLADAIEKAEPSVVAIAREKSENDETLAIRGRDVGRRPAVERQLSGLIAIDMLNAESLSFDNGSGVVVGEGGEILTAYHVVRGAKLLRVRAVGNPMFEAEIIAADPRSDLAVIAPRAQAGLTLKLQPIALGDATRLRKGAFLIALGNAFNAAMSDGRPSASWGILSNVARRIEPSIDQQVRQELMLRNYPTLLQLDSKLNLGMSGGAVINRDGELVGVTTAAANASGFDAQAGYAIPIDTLGRKIVETLKQGKEYEYGFLGISLDMQNKTSRVVSAHQGSPAADGGVQVDDVITSVGDLPVHDSDSLVVAINSVPAGEPVTLKILRRGQPIERTVHLAKLRLRGEVIATNRPDPWRGLRVDYISTVAAMIAGPDFAEAIARRGVVVSEVEKGSPADLAGLKKDQVIMRVEGKSVPNPRAFAEAVAHLEGPVKLETDQGRITVK